MTSSTVTIPNRPVFRAQEVCELAGLQPFVLRTWEAEFPELGTAKTPSSPRVYRRADVERVLRIKHLLFVDGLTRIGEHALARQLRIKTLELVMRHHDIYEYYHPLTGARPPKAAPLFGWSAALFVDLALQETAARQAETARP